MSLAKHLISVNIVVSLTMIVGLVNNIAIAGYFGLTRLIDTYYAAYMLPTLIMSLFVDFLGRNFLPVYSELKNKESKEADVLTSTIVNLAVIVMVPVTVLIILFSDDLFSLLLPGFSEADVSITSDMFRIMSVVVVLMAVNTFHVYVIQYHEKYMQVMLCKMLLPVALLISILVGHDYLYEYSLPVGVLAGYFLMFVSLIYIADYKYRLVFNYKSKYVKQIIVNTGILVSSGMITRLMPVIRNFYASMMDAGAISSINMADRICTPLQTSATIGVRMIAFTKASKLSASNDMKKLGRLNCNAIVSIMLMIVPIIILIAYHSDVIVRILFMRGEFDEQMHTYVNLALLGLLPAVVARSSNQVMRNSLYATNMVAVPAVIGITGTLLYLVLAGFMSEHFGILGLTLANSLSFICVFIAFLATLEVKYETFSSFKVLVKLLTYLTISILCAWVVDQVSKFIFDSELYRLTFFIIAGGLMYISTLAILNEEGFNYIKSKLLKKSNRQV